MACAYLCNLASEGNNFYYYGVFTFVKVFL